MMAHNLCYSTLLSREAAARLPASEVLRSPTGDAFVRKDLAVGILPEILEELLAARKRAKKDLKEATDPFDKAVLDGRQLVRRERQRVFFFLEREKRERTSVRAKEKTRQQEQQRKRLTFFFSFLLFLSFLPLFHHPLRPTKTTLEKKTGAQGLGKLCLRLHRRDRRRDALPRDLGVGDGVRPRHDRAHAQARRGKVHARQRVPRRRGGEEEEKEFLGVEKTEGKRKTNKTERRRRRKTHLFSFFLSPRPPLPSFFFFLSLSFSLSLSFLSLSLSLSLKNYNPNQVVYGDTDSVMVDFRVGDVAQAMDLGREAAEHVSATFAKPIKLEFEKVYNPYLLISKKRYAGLLWTVPEKWDKMDTKGIETVRRDNCALVRRVVGTCLDKLLIDRDVPGAAAYVKATISDLLMNRLDLSLLVITKALSKAEYDVSGLV